jgi:hypothetical protein
MVADNEVGAWADLEPLHILITLGSCLLHGPLHICKLLLLFGDGMCECSLLLGCLVGTLSRSMLLCFECLLQLSFPCLGILLGCELML